LDANHANLRRIQSSYFQFHFDEIDEVMEAWPALNSQNFPKNPVLL